MLVPPESQRNIRQVIFHIIDSSAPPPFKFFPTLFNSLTPCLISAFYPLRPFNFFYKFPYMLSHDPFLNSTPYSPYVFAFYVFHLSHLNFPTLHIHNLPASSVKITVKFIQRYNNTFATYHALINLKGGLIQTPPKSHFMQSTHKMWPKCIFQHLCIPMY